MYYNKALRKKRAAKRTLNAFLITAGLSVVLISLNSKIDNGSEPNYFLLSSGLILGTVSVVILPLYLIQVPLTWKFTKRSIDIFNQNTILVKGYKKDSSYLQFGISNNGVGLAYNF